MKKIIALGLLFLANLHVHACKCEEPFSISDEFQTRDLVVLGEVIAIQQIFLRETIDTSKIRLERLIPWDDQLTAKKILNGNLILSVSIKVKKACKGAKDQDTITIFTPRMSASCGYEYFKEGKLFYVYADKRSFLMNPFSQTIEV